MKLNEQLEEKVPHFINQGLNTSELISERFGCNRRFANRVLNGMAWRGEVLRHEKYDKNIKRVYYTLCIVKAHDPFNLTGRAYDVT